jgi:hypothetical protein
LYFRAMVLPDESSSVAGSSDGEFEAGGSSSSHGSGGSDAGDFDQVSCPSFKFIGVPVMVPIAGVSGQVSLSSFKLRGFQSWFQCW